MDLSRDSFVFSEVEECSESGSEFKNRESLGWNFDEFNLYCVPKHPNSFIHPSRRRTLRKKKHSINLGRSNGFALENSDLGS